MQKEITLKRNFIIGDKWLYYKLYSGPKTADDILTSIIKPVTEELLAKKIIDKWFFIRYSDPKLHLRVRFHYNNPKHIYEITSLINKSVKEYIEEDLIWKVQIDTYQRETERYGEKTMELAEDLFFHDSVLILNMLDMIEGDEGEIIRWLFGLRAIDSLLDDFGYDIQKKLELLNMLRDSFAKEFNMDKNLKMQIDDKFRKERAAIEEVLNKDKDNNSEMFPLFQLLSEKSKSIKPIAESIIKLKGENTPPKHINDLLASYIHMMINRLIKSKQRMHELVLYDFLFRYYKSEIAKKKYMQKT